MRNYVILICCALFNVVQAVEINSPGGKLQLAFRVSDGVPAYSLSSEGKRVIDISRLGFLLADQIGRAHV